MVAKATLWSTPISQSINPGWVILLTPLVVAFFAFLRRKNKEPSTATKIAFGLFISALSVLVMVAAVYVSRQWCRKSKCVVVDGYLWCSNCWRIIIKPDGFIAGIKIKPGTYYIFNDGRMVFSNFYRQ